MLADVSVDMGMAEYADGLVDEVYGQVSLRAPSGQTTDGTRR